MAVRKRKKKAVKKSVPKLRTIPAAVADEPISPSVGTMVKWYDNGWRYGTILAVKPRKRQVQIEALGPRKAFWIATTEVEVTK